LTPEFLSDAKAALQQSRAKETHLREQTVARFRAEQAKLAEEIARQQQAAEREAVDVAELAARAAELFERQPPRERSASSNGPKTRSR
jgi:hypothetical protein